jgi:outer membrane protein OmpA-like peptidoglycan-associated protein
MKLHRILGVAGLAVVTAAPIARAQNPGTLELGAFGQYTIFDKELNFDNAFGVGARGGFFIIKWLSVEGDISIQQTKSDVQGEDITYRPMRFMVVTHWPLAEKVRLHLGGGYVQSVYDGRLTPNIYEDGITAIAGLRICTGQRWGLRLDAVPTYHPSPNQQPLEGTSLHWSVRGGFSFYTRGGCIGEKFDWSMTVAPAAVTLRRGASQNLAITGTDMKGRSVVSSRFRSQSCTSSDPAVATVDNAGRVTAVRAGTATITCSAIVSGISKSGTSTVTVTFPTWTISVSPATATRDTGQTVQLAVTARDEDNVDVSAGATWSSSNANVASVSATGLVRCVSGGSATITASKTQYNESKSATAQITCNQPPPPPPPSDRMIISLDTIFFEFDKSDIRREGRAVLDNLIRLLTDSASWKISIEGHTDNYGSDEYNQRLSDRRAQTVLAYLTRRPGRIDASRVMWKGYSERCLIVPEGDKQQQAINRRVEVWQLIVLNAPPEQCRPRRQ